MIELLFFVHRVLLMSVLKVFAKNLLMLHSILFSLFKTLKPYFFFSCSFFIIFNTSTLIFVNISEPSVTP